VAIASATAAELTGVGRPLGHHGQPAGAAIRRFARTPRRACVAGLQTTSTRLPDAEAVAHDSSHRLPRSLAMAWNL
jgi:hypothetical protein